MAREDFQNRIARIQAGGGGAGVMLAGEGDSDTGGFGGLKKGKQKGLAKPGPGRATAFLIWSLLLPAGFILSMMTTIFLGPEITPEMPHYTLVMGFVAGGHLMMAAIAASALIARLRRKLLNHFVVASFAGYGFASSGLLGLLA